jgi:hypothetical protein
MTDLMNSIYELKDLLSVPPMEKDQEDALNRIGDKAMKVRPIALFRRPNWGLKSKK